MHVDPQPPHIMYRCQLVGSMPFLKDKYPHDLTRN